MTEEGRSPRREADPGPVGDFRVDLALGIARLVGGGAEAPVAGHALGPVAAGLLTTVKLASIPAEADDEVRERFASFIRHAAERVPPDHRVEPAPHILGPILEAIKYEPEHTPVDAMFSGLLSCAFDGTRAAEAHPSFPLLIRQLSSDEARILHRIAERGEEGTLREQFTWHEPPAEDYDPWRSETWIRTNPYALVQPAKFRLYAQHLSQLGLASIGFDHEGPSPDYINRIANGELRYMVKATTRAALTLFGQGFMRAVG